MKSFGYLNEKRMAVIIWAKKGDEDDVVVYAGKVSSDGDILSVQLKENVNLEISQWENRIKPVTIELKKTLLGADFCLSLSIADLPNTESIRDLIKTGLKWPT
jgi:hypothetical protein